MNAETKPKACVRISLPDDERGLNVAQMRRVDNLLRRVADVTMPKHKREEARDALRAIEEGRKASAEQLATDIHLVRLEALEWGREPNAPPTRDKLGRLRIPSRDGLEGLLAANAIVPIQYVAGIRYRELYEATERGVRSNLNNTISGSEDKRSLDSIGQKMQARKRLEAKVCAASRNGRGLMTLRLIAGQGRTIYALAPKSNANQKLYREALLIALDVCADHWGIQ